MHQSRLNTFDTRVSLIQGVLFYFAHFSLARILRSTHPTHPARPSLPASASRPVKIHVGEIKIIRSTGGTHLGGYWQDKCVILRVFVVACVFALSCAAFCLCGKSRKGKRGATRGKRPWVFSPRAFRADECGRSTHDPRFLSRKAELQERSFNKYERASREVS